MVLKMLQEFDLPARWTSLIQDHFAEAVHNLAQMWLMNNRLKFHTV